MKSAQITKQQVMTSGPRSRTFGLSRGFTLIELLVVIGILAVLLAITLIAINPARQFAQANNTKRRSDVNAILNAVHQYAADNKGILPGAGAITTTLTSISSLGANFCTDVVPQYIAALPTDPQEGEPTPGGNVTDCTTAGWDTHYMIQQIAGNNRITITAPDAELTETISVTR